MLCVALFLLPMIVADPLSAACVYTKNKHKHVSIRQICEIDSTDNAARADDARREHRRQVVRYSRNRSGRQRREDRETPRAISRAERGRVIGKNRVERRSRGG